VLRCILTTHGLNMAQEKAHPLGTIRWPSEKMETSTITLFRPTNTSYNIIVMDGLTSSGYILITQKGWPSKLGIFMVLSM
jgi:hypothetical protein